jgi:hypothetical protein
MNWLEKAIDYIVANINNTVVLVVGATILTLLIVIPVIYFESKIRKDKDGEKY